MKADDPASLPDIQQLEIASRRPLEGHQLDDEFPRDEEFVLEAFAPDEASRSFESADYPNDDDFEEQDVE